MDHLLQESGQLGGRKSVEQLVDDFAFCEAVAEPIAKRWQGTPLECPKHGILGLHRAHVVVVRETLQSLDSGPGGEAKEIRSRLEGLKAQAQLATASKRLEPRRGPASVVL